MFTKTFTIERHIEELRAINAELDDMRLVAGDLNREKEMMA